MRTAYQVVARLIALSVLVQAAAIALGVFIMVKDIDGGLIVDKDYDGNVGFSLHGLMGMMVVPLLAILFLIVSLFARVPGGIKWAGITFGLVVLQIVLAFVSFGLPGIGALHALNAFAVLFVAERAARRASRPASVAATPVGAEV